MLCSAVDHIDCRWTTTLKPFFMTPLTSTMTRVTQHAVCIIWSCIICAVHLLMSYKLLLCQNAIVSCPGNAINGANGHCILPLKRAAYNAWGLPDASARVWTNAPYKYPSFFSFIGWPWWRWNCCKFSWVMEHLYSVDQGSSAFLLLNDFHVIFPFWLHKQEQLWEHPWLVKLTAGKC